jgi:hypothetical protein
MSQHIAIAIATPQVLLSLNGNGRIAGTIVMVLVVDTGMDGVGRLIEDSPSSDTHMHD